MKSVKIAAAGLAVGALFLGACTGTTDREEILGVVRDLARFAEKDATDRILARLDPGYEDFEGRDRVATGALLDGYFSRYPAVVVNVLGAEVEELAAGEAVVRADLALSWGAARTLRKLAQVSLDNYRFQIRFRKTGSGWLVTRAEWRSLGAADLLSDGGR